MYGPAFPANSHFSDQGPLSPRRKWINCWKKKQGDKCNPKYRQLVSIKSGSTQHGPHPFKCNITCYNKAISNIWLWREHRLSHQAPKLPFNTIPRSCYQSMGGHNMVQEITVSGGFYFLLQLNIHVICTFISKMGFMQENIQEMYTEEGVWRQSLPTDGSSQWWARLTGNEGYEKMVSSQNRAACILKVKVKRLSFGGR